MMVKIDSSSRPRPPKSANPPFLGPDRGRSQADAAPGRAGDGHGEEESRADSKNASLSKVRGCGRFPFLVAPRLQLYFANWLNTETRQPPADKNGDYRRSTLTAPHPPFWRACVRPPWAPVTPPFSTRSDTPPRPLSSLVFLVRVLSLKQRRGVVCRARGHGYRGQTKDVRPPHLGCQEGVFRERAGRGKAMLPEQRLGVLLRTRAATGCGRGPRHLFTVFVNVLHLVLLFAPLPPPDPPCGSSPARGGPGGKIERRQVDPPQRPHGGEEAPGPTSQRLRDVSAPAASSCVCLSVWLPV